VNDKGSHVIFFDISKAFDTVSHAKLIYKLKMLGFSDYIVHWFESYLKNRYFVVRVNNVFSNEMSVFSCVPQGSTLGPLLFLIFMLDLPKVVKNCMLYLYADDCKLIKSIADIKECILLQSDINAVCSWYDKWQLAINVKKSTHFSYMCTTDFVYTANNDVIPFSDYVTDLGVTYDRNLDFSRHIDNIVRKAKYTLHRIFCLFSGHDNNFYLHMYITYVRPLLESSTPIWSPRFVYLINRLESVQRYFTRRVLADYDLSYNDRLKILGLKSLEERRIYFDVKLLHKIYFHTEYDLLKAYFRPVRSARLCYNFCNNYCSTEYIRHFWFNRVINYWNMLPNSVKCCASHDMFCTHLKDFDFSHCLRGVAHA
jgi:hypothetical protein